ncbi:response regulator [Nodosilinea sp. AN01ver1]|uniref:response regulator n=1 Tax=Nodosilinea sp. AN01ver1 TaxID=3423362 RepID=UPI003D310971
MANSHVIDPSLTSVDPNLTYRQVSQCRGATRQLLLIDNEPDICVLVQAALDEFKGWQVTTCCDPSTVDLATSPQWDAILLEISVVRLTGIALVPAFQFHPRTSHIPIVLLTSQVMARDYARFEQMGVAGVIAKPFDPVVLGDQIAQLLNWAPSRAR